VILQLPPCPQPFNNEATDRHNALDAAAINDFGLYNKHLPAIPATCNVARMLRKLEMDWKDRKQQPMTTDTRIACL
jgi:hypothetical protein